MAQNVFREAIAESVTYLTADSVSIQSITTILRKRVLRNSDYTILQSGQVSVRYTISVYIESLGYRDVATALADIQAQLKAAIESGFFDTLLLNYADLAGVLDILNGALSSNLVLVNYSVDEKAQPDEEFFTSWPMYGKVLFPIACIIVFIILVCLCMCCYDSHVHRKYTSAHSEGFMTSSGAAKASPKKAANNAGSLQSQLVNLLLGKDNISDTGSDGFYDVQSDGQALAGATIDANGQPASPGNAVISEKSVEIVLAEDNNGTQMISDSLATTTTKDGVVLTNNPVAGSTPTKPSIKSSNSPAPPQSPSALPKFVPDHPTIQSSHDAMSPLMSRSKPQLPNVPSVAMAADKGKKTQRSSLLGLINFSSPTKQRKEKFKGEKRNSKLSQATATTASTNDLQLVPTNSQSAAVSNSVPEALGSAEPSQTPPVGEHAVPETPLADQPIAEEAPHLEAQSSLGNLSPFNILGAFFGLNHPAEETVVENTEAVANEAANNDGHTEGGQVANHAGSTEQAPAPPSPSNPILHQENGQVAGTALPSSPAAAHVAAHTSAPTSPAPHPPASATANP